MCNKEQGYYQSQIPPEVASQLERADWEPEEALRFYSDGKHFDIVDGQTRILDTGGIASNALKSASLKYLELKGDTELAELRATIERQAAQIELLRDGLKRADDLLRTSYDHVSPLIREALSTTPDQALEQFAAKVRETKMSNQDCDHDFVFKGIVFHHSKDLLPGGGARERIYEDAYYCRKCLTHIYHNDREIGNSYCKVEFGAIPK